MRILLTILLVFAVVFSLFWSKPETQAELQALPKTNVVVSEVVQRDLQPVTRLTGKLQPARQVGLRLELSGRIQSRLVEPGQMVSTDEILLSIDDGDYQDRRAEAKAMLEQEQNAIARDQALLQLIRDEIEIQQREIKRQERLGQESLASKSSYDNAIRTLLTLKAEESRLRSSVSTASARLDIRKSALSLADRNLDRTQLRAPFDSQVNRVEYELGDYAQAGQIAVELVQLSQLDLYLEVTGPIMATLSIGQSIPIRIENRELQGVIVALSPEPKEDTLTHALRIRVDGKRLYSGQLAEAVLPANPLDSAHVVPVSAVLHEEGQAFLFIVEDGKLKRQAIELLARVGDLQAIEGVETGARIVSQDVAALADGQQVLVK